MYVLNPRPKIALLAWERFVTGSHPTMKKTLEDRQWHCDLYPVKFQDREEKREDAKGLIHISKTPCSSVIIIYELKISFI